MPVSAEYVTGPDGIRRPLRYQLPRDRNLMPIKHLHRRETWFATDPDRQLAYTYAVEVGRPWFGTRGRPPKYLFLTGYALAVNERGYADDESTRAVLRNYAQDELERGAYPECGF